MTETPAPSLSKIAQPQYIEFHNEAPSWNLVGGRSWVMRGQNYTLEYVEAEAGDVIRFSSVVEHIVIVPDGQADMTMSTLDHRERVSEGAVIILPSGTTEFTVHAATRLVHLVDIRDPNHAAAALNAACYQQRDPRIIDVVVTKRKHARTSPGVFLLSAYPAETGRFGTIFRSETFLVNILDPFHGKRDPDKLTPHHHEDFEQCSLAIEGEWVHHLRTPWGPRLADWREDEHRTIGSPSATIIPPPLTHTSESIGQGRNRLIDIFCPVREDFVANGWVLNSADYVPAQ